MTTRDRPLTYAPFSACGSGCLPRPGSVPTVGRPRRAGRLLALLLVLLAGIGVALLTPALTPRGRRTATRGWFRALVRAAGVRIEVRGPGLDGPGGTLVAANHVSWLDIPAVIAVRPVRVLGKSDVRRWPVVGYLASRGGTIFIDRRHLRTLPGTVADVSGALRAGEDVLVFPEGTTRCGRTLGRFHPALFQAAVDAGAPVRPVSLRYRLADGTPTAAAAFVGEDTLVGSIRRVVATRGLVIELEPGPLLAPEGTRRTLAAATATTVRAPEVLVPV